MPSCQTLSPLHSRLSAMNMHSPSPKKLRNLPENKRNLHPAFKYAQTAFPMARQMAAMTARPACMGKILGLELMAP